MERPEPQSNSDSRRLLITVHGIRTFGRWQEHLEELVKQELGPNTDVRHYRYGFFTILAFLIPPVRWLATRRFRLSLLHQLQRESWARVDIVAHSFGTHLVGWGLFRIQEAQRPKIHTLIFAGSVLKTSFPIRELIGKSVRRLVNDCGTRDTVLLVTQLCVPFTGMAGRVGFSGFEGDAFKNRFFRFGHSGYFVNGFTSKYWMPLLQTEEGIVSHDERLNSRFADLSTLVLNNSEPIKLICYLVPLLLLLAYVNGLRLNAEREAIIARSRELAAESRAVSGTDPILSLQLAINAGRTQPTKKAQAALISALERPLRASLYTTQAG